MNTNPMHFDREYAKKSQFKRCLINSGLTLAIVLGERWGPHSKRGCESGLGRGANAISTV
jgi:acyl dehydratase